MEMRITEANNLISKKAESIKEDYRLGYHIMAPANWMNDPNGCVFYDDTYHVFYQHNPFSEKWGPMYWGHVTSKDLINWKHESIALAPSNEFDKDGCFSGTAAINPINNELVVFYTGHKWINQKEDFFEQEQGYAISIDGVKFQKPENNKMNIEIPKDSNHHIRDPKVWHDGEKWNMILGNSTKEKDGRVLLYVSYDLVKWNYKGVMAKSNGVLGYMWECPDIFKLREKDILLFSPQGMREEDEKYKNFNQTGYVVGNLDNETGKLSHGKFIELDYGHDFYAVQSMEDKNGRRIVIAWMDMWESKMPSQEYGWAGAMTIPREIELMDNGKLNMKPVEELEKLRTDKILSQENLNINKQNPLNISWNEDSMEILIDIKMDNIEKDKISIEFASSNNEKMELVIDLKEESIKLIRDYHTKGLVEDYRYVKIDIKETLSLRIFVDTSSLEIFVNNGEYVLTSRMYPSKDDKKIIINSGESIEINNIDIWKLKNIWK